MRREFLKQADQSRHWEVRGDQTLPYYNILSALIGDLSSKRLLDVGCASGNDTKTFADRGLRAEGVDVKPEFVEEARNKYPELKFTVGSAEQLPFPDDSIDIVFSINTLFYTDTEKSIKEFLRVLKAGGVCIFSFDTEIINFEENKLLHTESLEHLNLIANANHAKIVHLGEETVREDEKPFRHRHTFRIVALQKRQN